ncbi:unnamed protein product [Cuscuta campestris]|uniref:Glucan endo-1,3-beta-D-glucosidase n=1 Tax=Cuscuta campestris TaxID=132261 RepID=A0A484N989_9ASTE|nr:unnamed protein product [Cuscuta campestris]
MRTYAPLPYLLRALSGTGIELLLGIDNPDLPSLADSEAAVEAWFDTKVVPFLDNVKIPYIIVGNEVMPGPSGKFLLGAIRNVHNVLHRRRFPFLQNTKVTTALNMGSLKSSTMYPSQTTFIDEAKPLMAPILQHLQAHGAPVLLNVLPYYEHYYNPKFLHADYALFTAPDTVVVQDGPFGYTNLFDATVDGFQWAIEDAGVKGLDIVVSESGWPHAGAPNFASPELAAAYIRNYLGHVRNRPGTPKVPPSRILAYFIYNLIDESRNQAARGDRYFGLLNQQLLPNYDCGLFP